MSDAPPIHVSVVVPVYNPGPHIDSLLTSLAAQTMPQNEFEIVLSDDGCTDDTPARLDLLAAEHENVTVLHEPNSGWPGRPRNLGMDRARGEYVFFVDQDDWLGVEALERMYAYAAAHNSDLIIGRYAGHNRGVAKAPFVRSRPDATLANTPLMDSLTPHKMFRTAFLRAHGLRFPEGRRRLEDHVFVAQAYFLAERIAILADYHCYFHVRRDDGGNAGYQRIDPPSYYGYVREVVDIVLAHTEPGTVRDRCLRRSLRTELLGRLNGRAFLAQESAYQRSLFDEARRLAEATMPLSVDAGLSPPQRVMAALLRADRLDDLRSAVRCYVEVRPTARMTDLHWDDEGALVIAVEGGLVDAKSEPWPYEFDEDRAYLRQPAGLTGAFPRAAAECSKQLRGARASIVLRRREDSEEWTVPTDSEPAVVHRDGSRGWVGLRAIARVDPRTVGGGAPLTSGVWDVFVRISQNGWTKDARLGSRRSDEATAHRRIALLPGHLVLPYWTKPHDNLSLAMDAPLDRALHHVGQSGVSARLGDDGPGQSLQLVVPIVVLPAAIPRLRVVLRDRERFIDVASVTSRDPSGELSMTVQLTGLSTGLWDVTVEGDQIGGPVTLGATISVSTGGLKTLVSTPRRGPRPAPDAAASRRPATISFAGRVRRKLRSVWPG